MNLSQFKKSQMMINPLPKIAVHLRGIKEHIKVDEMIKKLGKKRQLEILEERSQGFWVEDEVKHSLDRIRLRTYRLNTISQAQLNREMMNQIEGVRRNRRKTTIGRNATFVSKEKQHQCYLPQVREMNITRNQYSNSLIKARRRKIIHLLILGLNRRNLGRLIEALDIILLASYYFQKDDHQIQLKAICLNLISKLYKQIQQQRVNQRKKSKLNKRKRKTLSVVNYWSRQNFTENFMQKLRKTKLVGQFSYSDNKMHKDKLKRINAKCDVVVPTPEEVFGSESGVLNYDYVVITVDDHTNMFPYEYPKSLNEKISVNEYRFIVSKLNGLLFPQSKCYSFQSILKIFYLPFLLIFMIMCTFTLLRIFVTEDAGRYLLISVSIFCILMLGLKIKWEDSGYTNYIEIKDKMKEYLQKWENKYSYLDMKFRMGQNVDAIFIVFPTELPDSSTSSSKLTEIQEVDENFIENVTEYNNKFEGSKLTVIYDNELLKGYRRAGNFFDEYGGNIMKKRTVSRFATESKNSLQKQGFSKNLSTQVKENSKYRTQTQPNYEGVSQKYSLKFGIQQVESKILSQEEESEQSDNSSQEKQVQKGQNIFIFESEQQKIEDPKPLSQGNAKLVQNKKDTKKILNILDKSNSSIQKKKGIKFMEPLSESKSKKVVEQGQNKTEEKPKRILEIPIENLNSQQMSTSSLFIPKSKVKVESSEKHLYVGQKKIALPISTNRSSKKNVAAI